MKVKIYLMGGSIVTYNKVCSFTKGLYGFHVNSSMNPIVYYEEVKKIVIDDEVVYEQKVED